MPETTFACKTPRTEPLHVKHVSDMHLCGVDTAKTAVIGKTSTGG
jgi:hypothetical protein